MNVIKNYYAPTPKKWRKAGDALLAVALYAQTQQAFTGYSNITEIITVIGLVGKFLTNFFAEEDKKEENV